MASAVFPRRIGRAIHPARSVVAGFAAAITAGTVLLSAPIATESRSSAPLVDALFTATSAICVTGLSTVDTPVYWSAFGEVVIMLLIQTGGLGIMTVAAVLMLTLTRRIGFRTRQVAQAESKTLNASELRRVIRNVVLFSLAAEIVFACVLWLRFVIGYQRSVGAAAYDAIFHSVSAFNNAGFSLNSDSLMGYVTDPYINLTMMVAIVLGGLGFPVVFELIRRWRTPRTWTVRTRITIWTTVPLIVIGTLLVLIVEWSNPGTMGPLSVSEKVLASLFQSVTSRTAGFNSLDTGELDPQSLLVTDILMFIGGGSAGTAGGIKVTTAGLLIIVIWTELRGEPDVNVGNRRIANSTQRQAIAITLLGLGLVAVTSMVLLLLLPFGTSAVLFEAVSAFGTVGLSTGITADLGTSGKLVITMLMFVGRLGPLTLGAALASRERARRYELPEERPIVG